MALEIPSTSARVDDGECGQPEAPVALARARTQQVTDRTRLATGGTAQLLACCAKVAEKQWLRLLSRESFLAAWTREQKQMNELPGRLNRSNWPSSPGQKNARVLFYSLSCPPPSSAKYA